MAFHLVFCFCQISGFYAYKKVIKKVFGYNKHLQNYNVIHNVVTQLKANNSNEALNFLTETLLDLRAKKVNFERPKDVK